MANEAWSFVKNESTMGEIRVTHYLPDGTRAAGTPKDIANDGKKYRFDLDSTDDYLMIEAPKDTTDSRFNSVKLRADTDINLIYLRTNHTWKVQIIPNSLPPISPTTVNVTIGDDNP